MATDKNGATLNVDNTVYLTIQDMRCVQVQPDVREAPDLVAPSFLMYTGDNNNMIATGIVSEVDGDFVVVRLQGAVDPAIRVHGGLCIKTAGV